MPILNYSCDVWGFHRAIHVERVHTQYCKRTLQMKRCTQNDFVYGTLGRLDLTYNRYVRIVKFWLKIVCTNDCKLVYEVLNTDVNINPNNVSWVTLLKNLLSALGFYAVWLAQSVGNVDVFIHVFKQRLRDVNIQNWNSRIENSPRSTFFKNIVSFHLQFHLKCDLPCHFRVAMLIETGRIM